MAASTKTCRLEPRVYSTAERVAEYYGVTIGGAVRMLILSQDVRRQFLTPEEIGNSLGFQPSPSFGFPSSNSARVSIPSNKIQIGVRH